MKTKIKALNFEIDARSALPVYEQVKQEIKLLIMSGYLEEGDQLIPIRELALQLKVNANTIVKVYYQLDVEGFIYSQPGSGYFVKYNPNDHREEKTKLFDRLADDYISKSHKLGYSIKEMKDKINERNKKINHP